MRILNILSEEVNYEERFRLVLKNYTLLRSFYNLENFALCCSWIVVVCFAKGFSFLTHCIFFSNPGMYVSLFLILCYLSSLWMPSIIVTYDYDTLIFTPVPFRKK